MRVLVACEFSGIVRDAFIREGHDAVSCDLEPTEKPGPHVQGDVRALLCGGWDLMIAHPPCTYLALSGLHHTSRNPARRIEAKRALAFVRDLLDAPIPRICVENPVGLVGTHIRPADQYIQPWEHGHNASKKTGLWLVNLPPLQPSKCLNKPAGGWANRTDAGQDTTPGGRGQKKARSRTYTGIARAMARQWGSLGE